MNQVLIEVAGSEDDRKDIAGRIYTMCLQIGKITRHYKKESDAYPLNPDANVIVIEKNE